MERRLNRGGSADAVDTRLQQLFLTQFARCVRIADRVLADPGEAQDAAQDAFIAFHRRFGAQLPDSPAAWLHRASFHLALNRLRSARRRLLRELTAPPPRAGEVDPATALERKEERRTVTAALGRLRPKYAAVLALRYSGLSYRETAEALGVGTGQVGTLLRRAEAALRKEILREASE